MDARHVLNLKHIQCC